MILVENKQIFQIPTTDFTFKKIFGTEANKHFLIKFLNDFVSKYTGNIVDVAYLQTEKYGLRESERKAVFDILCTDQEKRNFIVEMQRAPQPDYAERSVFYLCRAVSASMEKGVLGYSIYPTYSVNILDFELPEYKKSGECFQGVFLKNHKNQILTKKVAIFYINLCNFAAEQPEVTEEMRNWLFLLKNMPELDEQDYATQKGFFKELMDECRIEKLDTMEKKEYQKSVLEYEDVKRAVAYAGELAAKAAYEEGIEKGITEGRKEGREEGREEGRMAALLQTAKNLLDLGLPMTDITKATGLTEEQIQTGTSPL